MKRGLTRLALLDPDPASTSPRGDANWVHGLAKAAKRGSMTGHWARTVSGSDTVRME